MGLHAATAISCLGAGPAMKRRHLRTVHPVPGGDHADHGRHPVPRGGGLSASLGVAPLPQVDFPTIQVTAQLPGGSPETMASSVAQPPGAAILADPRRVADDLDEFPRDLDGHRSVRSEPQHRRCGQRHPGGDQRRRRPAAEEPADPADLSEGQPGRFADPPALGHLRHPTADRRRRCGGRAARPSGISQISGVAQVFIGGQQKPAIRIQVDPAKLVAKGLSLEDVRTQPHPDHGQQPQGQLSTAAATATRSTPTTSSRKPRTGIP